MLLIFVESNYFRSIWCQNLVDGLVTELKLKRMAFRFIASLEEMAPECPYIFVIGSSGEWVRTVLEASCQKGIYPILLCNQAFHELDLTYSTVCSDTSGSMQHLVDTLVSTGRTRIALYGVNPHSVSDESRKKGFQAATGKSGGSDIYINDGSLKCCFQTFWDRISEYDAVVCANDFAAISLVRNLLREKPGELDRLLIIGCAETRLTELYNQYVLSIRVNFAEYGRAALSLLDCLKKNPYLAHIVMAIRWDFSPLTEVRNRTLINADRRRELELPQTSDTFYQDGELYDMLRLEWMLNECDDLDQEVIAGLLRGESYEALSERCYTTVSTIKYRVKKMLSASRAGSRRELVGLIREYFTIQKMQDEVKW